MPPVGVTSRRGDICAEQIKEERAGSVATFTGHVSGVIERRASRSQSTDARQDDDIGKSWSRGSSVSASNT